MPTRSRVVSGGFIATGGPSKIITITLPFTETWTGADNPNSLDGDFLWNDFIGTHQWGRVSNTARLFGATGVSQGGYLNQNTGTDDVLVTLSYPLYAPGTNVLSAGPMVRMTGTTVFTGYCASVLTANSATTLTLLRFLAGVQTTLASVPVTPHNGQTATVSALGNRIRAAFDGITLIDLTDLGIPSGRFVGLQGFNNGTSDVKVDNLGARSSSATFRVPLELLTLSPLVGVH